MEFEYSIEGGDFVRAGAISSEVKKILKQLNVDAKIIKKTVIALYEGEVNVVAHAHSGTVKVSLTESTVTVVIADKGPGIENIEMALQEGFSTASQEVREMGFGAGMGLPNIRRNTDRFNLESTVNEGTTLTLINNIKN